MTEYVLLHPDGDTFTLVPALVDKPILTTVEHAPKTVRRLALERELAALDAEEGIMREPSLAIDEPGWAPPSSTLTIETRGPMPVDEAGRRYAGTYLGADGVARTELHFTEQRPGPQHVCECSQAFYDRVAYVRHSQSCAVHTKFVSDPRYEPGAFVQGSTEQHPYR